MGRGASAYLRRNRRAVAGLPPPSHPWVFREVPIDAGTLQSLQHYDLIEAVGTKDIDGTVVTVWRTCPDAWRTLQAYRSNES